MKALLWIVVAVVVIGGAAYFGVAHHSSLSTAGQTATTTANPFGAIAGSAATSSTSTMTMTQTSSGSQASSQTSSGGPSATVSASSGGISGTPDCTKILTTSLLQQIFPGQSFTMKQQNEGYGNAFEYICKATAGSAIAEVDIFTPGATDASDYQGVIKFQEGYGGTCTDVSGDVGFSASNCLAKGQTAGTAANIVFFSPNSAYAQINARAQAGSANELSAAESLAKAVHSML
jgi:hypothetical protein